MADPADPLSADADSQTTGLYINLAIGVPVTVLCLLLFDPLRRRVPSIFETRRQLNQARDPLDYTGNRVTTPPAPSFRIFGWLLPTLRLDLETIADTHGLDAALFLRYHRFMLALFSSLALPAALLLPVYYTASNKHLPESDPARTLGVNKFSLSNVVRADPWRFWLLLAVEYAIAVFVCFHIIFQFAIYCRDRRRYRAAPHPANYAILIQDIPPPDCSEEAVRHYWNRVFPDQIAAVFFVRDARRLEKDKTKFWNAVNKREAAEWRLYKASLKRQRRLSKNLDSKRSCTIRDTVTTDSEDSLGKKPRHCFKLSPKESEAAVHYWEEQQLKHWARVSAHQIKRDEGRFANTQSAIVVFKSRRAASIASQTNFARKEDEWRVSRVPEPNAINWLALGVSGWTIYVRQAMTTLLCVALTLFWIIPVTAIMGLVNLSNLIEVEINGEKPFLFLENIRNLPPVVVGFVESWLPTVVLTVFLAIVPKILEFFVSISRIVSHARKDSLVRDWYFMFITFSNFLFVAFAGTLLDELAVILDRPASTVEILARNIPKQAAFMMNFIVLTALTETPRELLQIMRVGKRWVQLRFQAKTKRQRDEADVGDMSMDFVAFYAMGQLIALLGLVYCTIQPFIIFCCIGYFGISYIVFKYNICYSLHNEYEDGGRMFGGALYAVWLGLFAHLLTMIGVFGLNKSAAQSALIIIPSVVAVLFVLHCNKSFDRVIEHGSALETQDRLEELEGRTGGEDLVDPKLINCFEHPGFEPLPELNKLENLNGVENEALKLETNMAEAFLPEESFNDTFDSHDLRRGSNPPVIADFAGQSIGGGTTLPYESDITHGESETSNYFNGSILRPSKTHDSEDKSRPVRSPGENWWRTRHVHTTRLDRRDPRNRMTGSQNSSHDSDGSSDMGEGMTMALHHAGSVDLTDTTFANDGGADSALAKESHL